MFDGHNDALTRADHAGIATGRPDGHLDLPRMREGGMRGGIFAICVESPDPLRDPVARDDGVNEFALAEPVAHPGGAEAIDPGLESLEHWHAAGLRSLGPVWSRPTVFGHGVSVRVSLQSRYGAWTHDRRS